MAERGLKALIYKIFPKGMIRRRAVKDLIVYQNSYLNKTGWLQSRREGLPVDGHGEVIPWMNYPVVHFLKSRLHSDLKLFEYGSGFSTRFYAARVKEVVSVEYDKDWYDHVQKDLPANARVIFQANDEDGDYCRAIQTTHSKWDVVIVDGRDRVNCLLQSAESLSEAGVLILDDSSREKYAKALPLIQDKGFRILEFEGLKPHGRGIDRTTIFYRDGNCLGI